MNKDACVYITDIDRAREHGLPWRSVHSARWDFRNRHKRGVASAFVKIGRKIAVYPDVYHRLTREKQMNHDDESAALAQKQMDERRRQEDELLENDPGYALHAAKVALQRCVDAISDIEELLDKRTRQ